jgi:hypothetical protein
MSDPLPRRNAGLRRRHNDSFYRHGPTQDCPTWSWTRPPHEWRRPQSYPALLQLSLWSKQGSWRKARDSNPQSPFGNTRFPVGHGSPSPSTFRRNVHFGQVRGIRAFHLGVKIPLDQKRVFSLDRQGISWQDREVSIPSRQPGLEAGSLATAPPLKMVRTGGLEPPRAQCPLGPQPSASTSSATFARLVPCTPSGSRWHPPKGISERVVGDGKWGSTPTPLLEGGTRFW